MKFVTLECCSCSDFQVLFKFFCQAWNLSAVAVLSFKFYSSFFCQTWNLSAVAVLSFKFP